MDEVAEPFLSVRIIVRTVGWHVERSLSEEGLGVGRHVAEIIHHHEHLDHGAQGIEQGQLDGASVRNPVALLAKIDVALEIIEWYAILKLFCILPNMEKHSWNFHRVYRRIQ